MFTVVCNGPKKFVFSCLVHLLTKSPKNGVHPIHSLPAWRALTTRLVLVERHQSGDGLHHIRLLVHHNDGGGAKAGLGCDQRIKIHHNVIANAENENREDLDNSTIDI